jgi:NTP pyrophosphatase (non-canonical NTP hydrolase)
MPPTSDSFRDLARSTLDFYARFGATPKREPAIRKFEEEVRELIDAARDGSDPAHIAEEAADVFVTAMGICFASGIDTDGIIEQIYAVIAKNDVKTPETHAVIDGTIRRRLERGDALYEQCHDEE